MNVQKQSEAWQPKEASRTCLLLCLEKRILTPSSASLQWQPDFRQRFPNMFSARFPQKSLEVQLWRSRGFWHLNLPYLQPTDMFADVLVNQKTASSQLLCIICRPGSGHQVFPFTNNFNMFDRSGICESKTFTASLLNRCDMSTQLPPM